MNRRDFISIAGATIAFAGGVYYSSTDKRNFVRADIKEDSSGSTLLKDEIIILYQASLAPSGHNTQPWFVKYIEPTNGLLVTIKANGFLALTQPKEKPFYQSEPFYRTLNMLQIIWATIIGSAFWPRLIRMKT